MALAHYSEAAKSYAAATTAIKALGDAAGTIELIFVFNTCESERRATGNLNRERWAKTVQLFEEKVKIENLGPEAQANMLQAMHVPYACVGKVEKALEVLGRAEKCAELTGKVGKIFCVKTYTYISVDEFLAANEEMATALKSHRLWDGMLLPK